MSVSHKDIECLVQFGPMWVRCDRDDNELQLRCRKHPHVAPFTGLNTCYECIWDNYRHPPRPEDIERPEFWADCTLPTVVWPPRPDPDEWAPHGPMLDHTRPAGPGLHCEYHDTFFELTQACRVCLWNDIDDWFDGWDKLEGAA